MTDEESAWRFCLASSTSWRRMASNLRDHATGPHLTDPQRAQLLREADAADRQADWWLAGAIDAS